MPGEFNQDIVYLPLMPLTKYTKDGIVQVWISTKDHPDYNKEKIDEFLKEWLADAIDKLLKLKNE